MREKRTVVWERKRTIRGQGSPAAERIRAAMQPSAWTRLTDGVFEKADALVERVDRFEGTAFSPKTTRWKRMAYGFAAALLGALFVAVGESVALGPYAGRIAAPSILIAALIGSLFAFNGRHPPRDPPRILLGLVLFVLISTGVWLVSRQ